MLHDYESTHAGEGPCLKCGLVKESSIHHQTADMYVQVYQFGGSGTLVKNQQFAHKACVPQGQKDSRDRSIDYSRYLVVVPKSDLKNRRCFICEDLMEGLIMDYRGYQIRFYGGSYVILDDGRLIDLGFSTIREAQHEIDRWIDGNF